MKTIHYLFIIPALILTGSLFYACTKEQDNSLNTTGEFEFAISAPSLKNGNSLKSAIFYTLSDATKIVLTIQFNDGSPTKYNSSEVKILQMNGNFYTQKLALKTGTYKLTEFVLIDSIGNTIFAAPLAGSQEAQNVTNPLPIVFTVSKNTTTPVIVEVLSAASHTPEDFGLSHFPVIEVKTFSFMIGVVDNSNDKILPAKLTVSNGAYAYVQNLDSVLNNVVTVKDGLSTYTLTVENTGYITYTHTYTIDSLKIFTDSVGNLPLLVELEKVNELTVTDIDGNVYHTITIGAQVWMVENLRTTRYNDGAAIPLVTDNTAWANLTTPGYCWYNNDLATHGVTYGALYNWYTVNTGKLAPSGWHVPTHAEWTILIDYLGGDENVAGGKLKETGTAHWASPNTGATNETGFTALPGGGRVNSSSIFYYFGNYSFWWSTTEYSSADAYLRGVEFFRSTVTSYLYPKITGFSVRCLQD